MVIVRKKLFYNGFSALTRTDQNFIQNTLSIIYELQINGLCLLKQGPPPSSLKGISRCLSFLYKKMMKTNIVCLGITNFVVEEF
jgi:hypothetical protein